MTPPEFARAYDVSRETLRRLEVYVALLTRWNRRINLIGPATTANIWSRHIADSAQLFGLAPAIASWIDLGSGAGLPALPVAALAAGRTPALDMTMVESDTRKAAFLSTASREMGLEVTIKSQRAESLPPSPYGVVSARALAPLDRLCAMAYRFSGQSRGRKTIFLFPKGVQLDSELTAARDHWHICAERIASRTDPEATILKILELEPRS